MQNSWLKYGEDKFIFEVIECVEEVSLLEKEQYWIDNTQCYVRNIGYNIQRYAGRGMAGMNHTEETKKKMSEKRKGEKHHLYGKNHTEESKQKNERIK